MYRLSGYGVLSRIKSRTAHRGLMNRNNVLNNEYAMTNWEYLTVVEVIVNNIYHKPYDTIENLDTYIYMGEMAEFFSVINRSNTYLVGDFNIDLL